MLWPIICCSSHLGVCLGRSVTTDIMDMWMNTVVMLMVVQIGQDGYVHEVRCELSAAPRKEADMTGVVMNCTLCDLITTLCTVEMDILRAHTQDFRSDAQVIGVTSQKGDINDNDW